MREAAEGRRNADVGRLLRTHQIEVLVYLGQPLVLVVAVVAVAATTAWVRGIGCYLAKQNRTLRHTYLDLITAWRSSLTKPRFIIPGGEA